jgi:hypothetical protein
LIEEKDRRSFLDGVKNSTPVDTLVDEPRHWMGKTIRGVHFEEFERCFIDFTTHSEKAFISTLELINTLKMVTTNYDLR